MDCIFHQTLKGVDRIVLDILKVFLQVVSLTFFSFILVSQNFDLLFYAFGVMVLLYIVLGYEELKVKKNLGNGIAILSAVVVMSLFLGFSLI